jgi:hypothetical protein
MNNILLENINRAKKLMNVNESDISGIDELVYNPITGPGGAIGYGYDNGVRKAGIEWSGHEDHLHIAFTDKQTAIAVIDKADSLGLVTTENPYAKKDPNKHVDNVHTNGSFHYKTFEGDTPLVGKAVDISGNESKILELIKWINSTYASGNPPTSIPPVDAEYNKILDLPFGDGTVKDQITTNVTNTPKSPTTTDNNELPFLSFAKELSKMVNNR